MARNIVLYQLTTGEPSDSKIAISKLLEGNSSVDDTVKVITNPTIQTFQSSGNENLESCMWSLWFDIITIASKTPHTEQAKLVELMQNIRKLPPLVREDGTQAEVWGSPFLWDSLPIFGASMRETWNYDPHWGGVTDELNLYWVNLNGFAARITAASTSEDSLDYSNYGEWGLHAFNEEDSQTDSTLLQVASIWMIYASDKIYDNCVNNKSFGNSAFSLSLWKKWKESFSSAMETCERKDINFIDAALAKMNEAEKKVQQSDEAIHK